MKTYLVVYVPIFFLIDGEMGTQKSNLIVLDFKQYFGIYSRKEGRKQRRERGSASARTFFYVH